MYLIPSYGSNGQSDPMAPFPSTAEEMSESKKSKASRRAILRAGELFESGRPISVEQIIESAREAKAYQPVTILPDTSSSYLTPAEPPITAVNLGPQPDSGFAPTGAEAIIPFPRGDYLYGLQLKEIEGAYQTAGDLPFSFEHAQKINPLVLYAFLQRRWIDTTKALGQPVPRKAAPELMGPLYPYVPALGVFLERFATPEAVNRTESTEGMRIIRSADFPWYAFEMPSTFEALQAMTAGDVIEQARNLYAEGSPPGESHPLPPSSDNGEKTAEFGLAHIWATRKKEILIGSGLLVGLYFLARR
jgi:hypothetical protein